MLRACLLVPTTFLLSFSSSSSSSSSSEPPRAIAIPLEDVLAFETAIDGDVTLPSSRSYQQDKKTYMDVRLSSNPAGLINVKSTADVSKAIQFLDAYHQHPRVKSGGNSFAGQCQLDDGWVIDMKHLKAMSIDEAAETLTLESGLRFDAIYEYLEDTPFSVAGGVHGKVGAAGYLLGGGRSPLSRKYGWAADTIVSMQVVLADGSVVTASESDHPLLFWALRGAGHNNFGVVVEFTVRVFREKVSHGIYVFPVAWNRNLVINLFSKFVRIAPDMPHNVAVIPVYTTGIFTLLMWTVGDDNTNGTDWLATFQEGFFPALPGRPLSIGTQAADAFDYGAMKSRYYPKSFYYQNFGPEPEAFFTQIFHDVMSFRGIGEGTTVYITHYGGKIAEIPDDANAISFRDAPFLLTLERKWKKASQDTKVKAACKAMFERAEAAGQVSHVGAYINYADEELLNDNTNWQEIYYGNKVNKLRTIKQKYDPMGFFQHEFGVSV